LVLTLPAESTMRWPLPNFLPDINMRICNRMSRGKRARFTQVRVVLGDEQGRVSQRAVAEYQAITAPRMRVRHFNIASVAWSNFKPGVNTNGRRALFDLSLSIDVVSVGAGVDEAIVALRDDRERG
jgi:hypothetical protein